MIFSQQRKYKILHYLLPTKKIIKKIVRMCVFLNLLFKTIYDKFKI